MENVFVITDCSSLILGDSKHYDDFVGFANDNLIVSFEYLFLSAQFGTHMKDRPGFEKVLHGLSDKAWNNGIEMIKESAKRGVKHNFTLSYIKPDVSFPQSIYEMNALAKAAEIEKNLLIRANDIHRHHSHASVDDKTGKQHGYDAGISHYLEEEIIEGKTQTVRNLVGHVNDLKTLLARETDTKTFALSLYLFDQYLQK